MTTALPAPPTSELPEPTTTRWRPLRAGLQNVWQYDHATRFVFHAGRLLLRGRNGSGKTKAVELLLPFLLEGRLDPARLDPFRTRSRKMHYNLLHEANRDLTVNVGYVWLEFGMLDGEGAARYLTVGAGMKASRSDDKVSSWFFTVSGRRIDVDLQVLDADRRPLGKAALAESLGDDGRVYDSGRDYAAAVNRGLYGLTVTQYEALVEAVLRLRQPHLSERLDPAGVGAVLSDSLPPLDAEKVHEVAEGFERLESHRRELADRRRSLDAVETFLAAYRDYAATLAAVRARTLVRNETAVQNAAERIRSAEAAQAVAADRVTTLEAEREQVGRDQAVAATRVHTLETSDEYRAVQELEGAQEAAAAADRRHRAAAARHDGDEDQRIAAERARDGAARRVETMREQVGGHARDAQSAAAHADLTAAHGALAAQVDAALGDDEHAAGQEPAAPPSLDAPRGTAAAVERERTEAVATLRAHQQAVSAAEATERGHADRLADAEERLRAAQEHAAGADRALVEARESFAGAVQAWAADAVECALADEAVGALTDAEPSDAAGFARDLARPARDRLDTDAAQTSAALAAARTERERVTAERTEVEAAAHTPPAAPAWRDDNRATRAGAPLYLLAEPAPDLPADQAARLEAALEAAGVLDAWITPEGRVLDRGALDAAVVAGDHATAPTLVDVLVPTPAGDVEAEVIQALLARVALVPAGAEPDTAARAWVSADGRFGIGPLRGAADSDEVRYLGQTARARTRARRLAALDARLAALAGDITRLTAARDAATQRRASLESELDAFPSAAPVLRAAADASAAARATALASAEHEQARTLHEDAVEAVARTAAERDEAARALGLTAHVDRLDALAAATQDWSRSVAAWLSAAQRMLDAVELLRIREDQTAAAASRAQASAADVEDLARQRAAADERVTALRSLVGAEHEHVVADLAATRQRHAHLEARAAALVTERIAAGEAHAVADKELEVATAEHARLDGERAAAAAAVRNLAALGVLQVVTGREFDDPGSWGVRATLDHAREAARHGPRITSDEQATALVEDAQNTLARRQQELTRDLVAGIRLFGRTDHGVVVHDVQYGGRTFRLPGLVAELREDVAERDQRLAADEQGLLEQFLAGELHEHLRSRIRDAGDLVDAMNGRLAACPTASGQRVRLRWEVDEDAPAGSRQAVDLLLRGAGLLTDDQRSELRAFLHDRLRQAREGDAAASLQERIAGAFDYRAWHTFRIEVRDATTPTWRRLTRQSHATGSGGEKAVMLHLPLFAAMAAHYQACPSAPRLIVLDEVFAGIDRGTRGQLMGLLVELDLDALLTSHEEWGFYAELDGLSTYHLVRDADVPGVLTEWFVWDGAQRWELP